MNNVSMEQRIASVLAGDAITSFDLSTLMQDVEAAADDADATAEAERTRALDPAQPVEPIRLSRSSTSRACSRSLAHHRTGSASLVPGRYLSPDRHGPSR